MKFDYIYTLLQNSRKIDEYFITELEKLIMFILYCVYCVYCVFYLKIIQYK